MTDKVVHELNNGSGTVIVSDEWPEGEFDEGYGPCINYDKCNNNVSPDAGIHQFCRSCYQSWASAWFRSARSSEEE
jgi:hypothetical protein